MHLNGPIAELADGLLDGFGIADDRDYELIAQHMLANASQA